MLQKKTSRLVHCYRTQTIVTTTHKLFSFLLRVHTIRLALRYSPNSLIRALFYVRRIDTLSWLQTTRWHLLALPIVMSLAACSATPTTQITAFADSTKAITEKVNGVVDEYNQAVLMRNFTDYAATYTGAHSNQLTSDLLGQIQLPINEKTRQGLALYQANRAISAYAKSLSALAIAGSRSDIDWASSQIFGAFTSANEQYKTLTNKSDDLFKGTDFALITKAFAAITGSILEAKRNEALKEIILAADLNIGILCDEISNQIGKAGIDVAVAASRQYILTEEIKDYKEQLKVNTTLEWRRTQIQRLYGLKQGITTSTLLSQDAQQAIQAVKAAHATLAAELRNNQFNSASVAIAIGRLKELETHYDNYESLLLSCKKIDRKSDGNLFCADTK